MTGPGNAQGAGEGRTPGGAARPGGLAEEILRLVETVTLLTAGHARSGTESGTAVGSECRGCPVCRLLGIVRGLRPEVVEHLVAAGAAAGEELLAAAREFAASTEPDVTPPTGREGRTEDPRGASRPARTVQRIELE